MEARTSRKYEMVVDIDLTSPLRTVKDLENLVEKQRFGRADVTFSVTESRRNPYFNMVKKTENGYERVIKSDFVSRQQAPEIFDMNASLYAYRPEFLLSGRGIFEGICDVIYMKDTGVLDLDHEGDFELMEVIADYLFQNEPAFAEVKGYMIGKSNAVQ